MRALVVLLFLLTAAALRADTIYFVNGREMEGKIVQQDDSTIRLEVETGVVVIPKARVKRIEMDTPEQAKAREDKKAAAAQFAAKMKDEGKVLYKGKWVYEEEMRAEEAEIAAAKKKARAAKEAEDARKTREAEVAAARAQLERAQLYGGPYTNHGGVRSARRDRSYDYGLYGDSYYGTHVIPADGILLQDGYLRNYRRY